MDSGPENLLAMEHRIYEKLICQGNCFKASPLKFEMCDMGHHLAGNNGHLIPLKVDHQRLFSTFQDISHFTHLELQSCIHGLPEAGSTGCCGVGPARHTAARGRKFPPSFAALPRSSREAF